jgi:hypothetical protein
MEVDSCIGEHSRYKKLLGDASSAGDCDAFDAFVKEAHAVLSDAKMRLRAKIANSLGKPAAEFYKKALVAVLSQEKDEENALIQLPFSYHATPAYEIRIGSINRQLHFLQLGENNNAHYHHSTTHSFEGRIPGVNCDLDEFSKALVAAGMYKRQARKVIDRIKQDMTEQDGPTPKSIIEAISKPTHFWGSNLEIANALFESGVITQPLRDAIVLTSKEKNRNIGEIVGVHDCETLFEPAPDHPGFGNATGEPAEVAQGLEGARVLEVDPTQVNAQ